MSDGKYRLKVKVKTCSESYTSCCSSSNDEEDMPYNVLLQNGHMISLQYKNYKNKIKYICLQKHWVDELKWRFEKENPDSGRKSKSNQ